MSSILDTKFDVDCIIIFFRHNKNILCLVSFSQYYREEVNIAQHLNKKKTFFLKFLNPKSFPLLLSKYFTDMFI